jgi:ADP-ribose pyrophosphatase YjhB (NUDIX family)
MDTTRIRPIAVCLFRHDNRILVSEGFDTVKQDYYYRPLGGGIEYGEMSSDALVREIREELDAEIENVRLLGVLENILFTTASRDTKSFLFSTPNLRTNLYTDATKSTVTSRKPT